MVKVVELNLLKNLQQVEEISEQIIGMQLVTPQTSAEGVIAEDVYPGESLKLRILCFSFIE
jgi:succinyl-CoA synthetase beta subunit